MTVVVGFLCSDGAVIAADSMLTPQMGNLATGHHNARKIHLLQGNQLFAYAGDQGQAHRFAFYAEYVRDVSRQAKIPYDVVLNISFTILDDFTKTKITIDHVRTDTLLAFRHSDAVHLCAFISGLQPMLLDAEHFYCTLGSGKQMADPFLAFLLDTFSPRKQPTMREAVFMATWVLEHVIRTNPGGVAGPIRIGLLPTDPSQGGPRELGDHEVDEQRQAIEDATKLLRTWRDTLSGISPVPPSASPPPSAGPASG